MKLLLNMGFCMLRLKSKIAAIIQSHVTSSNRYIIGFSYLKGLLPKIYEDLDYGITIGIELDDLIIGNIIEGPTVEYLEHYSKVNTTLNKIALDVKKMLKEFRNKAEIIKATIELGEERKHPNYIKTLSVDFPHKTAATRSGLGWIGKSALFVSKEFGPRIRLVTILTNQKLNTERPVDNSFCGRCDICVKKCPAQASNGKSWSVDMRREDFFNAFKCWNTAKEIAKLRIGMDDSICGICIAVCPVGKMIDKI